MPASMVSADERSGQSSARAADLEDVAHELARLEALDLTQLRVQFRNRTGRVAPAQISRPLLLRLIGYRLQAERFGDLPPDTRRFLDRLASAAAASSLDAPRADDRASVAAAEGRMRLRSGTVLLREWQGRLEQVRVLPDGFGWNGATYASLSAVASAITGTRWNGHRFFGLGRHGKAAKAASVHKAVQIIDAGGRARARTTGGADIASVLGNAPVGRTARLTAPSHATAGASA